MTFEPDKPDYATQGEQYRTITRNIRYQYTDNGANGTLIQQKGYLGRTKTVCNYGEKPCDPVFGPWFPFDGNNWEKYDIPQLSGYETYVDGVKTTEISEEQIGEGLNTTDKTITVEYRPVEKEPETPTPPTKPEELEVPTDPNDPAQADYFKKITRTISIKDINGKETSHTQEVIFFQTKTDGKFNNDWTLWKGSPKGWDAYEVKKEAGYTSYIEIDGQPATSIDAVDVNPNTQSSQVKVEYQRNHTDVKISYVDEDGKTVASLDSIDLFVDQTITAKELTDHINKNLPEGYELVDPDNLPVQDITAGVENGSHDINVPVKLVRQTIKPGDVSDPEKDGLRSKVTRTINIELPNGDKQQKVQTVIFERNKLISGTNVSYSDWEIVSEDKKWNKVEIDSIDGYKSFVDGKETSLIDGKSVAHDSGNETINVHYEKIPVTIPTDPNDPAQKDHFKTITRTINTKYADGVTDSYKQEVTYYRTKTGDKFNDDWTLWKDSPKGWDAYEVTNYPGHSVSITIDGQKADKINSQDITSNSKDSVVNIEYTRNHADIKISYVDENGKTIHTVPNIDVYGDEKVTAAELKEIIQKEVPSEYEIINLDDLQLDDVTAEKDNASHSIEVKVKLKKQVITPDQVEDAEKEGFIKRITRTINITLPNGDKKQKVQTVTYQRNKIVESDKESWTNWELAKGSDKGWTKFNVDQIDGYDSLVDGEINNVIEEKDVNHDDQDVTVEVSYKAQKQIITPDQVEDPEKEGFVKRITRTINITLPNGEKKQKVQTVTYQRNKVIEAGKTSWTNWELANGSDKGWTKFNVDQIDGYDSLVDGEINNVVEEKDVNWNDEDVSVNVSYKAQKQVITPDQAENPEKEGFIKRITRTINITLPNGEKKQKVQTVTYQRNKIIENGKETWTNWELAKGSDKGWAKYNVDQIDGYDSLVDGEINNVVEERDVNHDDNNATVEVSYKAQKQIITPDQVENPEKDGFVKRITRTINITLPNGEKKQKLQTVTYQRNKVIEAGKTSWTNWELTKGSDKGWAKFNVDQIDGYDSLVDSEINNVVEEKAVNHDDNNVTVEVSYKAQKQIITPNQVETPEKEGFIKRITRTINIILPNGDKKQKVQTVTYQRNKVIEAGKTSWTNWELAKGSDKGWAKFNVDQIDGYTSLVNNKVNNVVEEQDVNWDDKDEVVEVSYINKEEKLYDLKVEYYDENSNRIHYTTIAQLKDKDTFTKDEIKDAIDKNLPDGYELADNSQYPNADVTVNGKDPADIKVTIRLKKIVPTNPDADDQQDMFKKINRHIHIVAPSGKESVEKQTIIYSRTKTQKRTSSLRSLSANENIQWNYSEWQLYEGHDGTWQAHKLPSYDGHIAKIKYPKFLDDIEDRELEADEVEARSISIDPKDEDPNDIERHVYVTYTAKTQEPSTPGGDDKPEQPGDGDDKPSKPEQPGDDNKPSTPGKPGDGDDKPEQPDYSGSDQPSDDNNKPSDTDSPSDNIDDDSQSPAVKPEQSDSNKPSESTTMSPSQGDQNSNQTNYETTIPLPEDESAVNITEIDSSNDELPDSGNKASTITQVGGLIALVGSALLATISYVFKKKKE